MTRQLEQFQNLQENIIMRAKILFLVAAVALSLPTVAQDYAGTSGQDVDVMASSSTLGRGYSTAADNVYPSAVSTAPVLGMNVKTRLSSFSPNVAGTLFVGALAENPVRLSPFASVFLDLGTFDEWAAFPFATDDFGTARVEFAIPDGRTFEGVSVGVQAMASWGSHLEVTNGLHWRIGR